MHLSKRLKTNVPLAWSAIIQLLSGARAVPVPLAAWNPQALVPQAIMHSLRNAETTLISAHRGDQERAVENTYRAFQDAPNKAPCWWPM
jgi:hypothetical protein